MDNLVPLNSDRKKTHRRVFEFVCDDIRRQLAQGLLHPGDKLAAERELAEQLSVSRAAVREALRALEASGVLEFRQGTNGGAFIRDASSSGIRSSISDMLALGKISLEHLGEVRTALLALAARMACERANEADFDLIAANIERCTLPENEDEHPAVVDAITEFYVLLGNASHNGVLRILIEGVTDVARDLLMEHLPIPATDLMMDLPKTRRTILKALRARHSEKAAKLVSEHMTQILGYVLEHSRVATAPNRRSGGAKSNVSRVRSQDASR